MASLMLSVSAILIVLLVALIPTALVLVVLYFIIKAAVRNGVQEALQARDDANEGDKDAPAP